MTLFSLDSIRLLFDGANIFVLPFWAVMVLLPNWGVTRKIMGSTLPFVALALVYGYLFVASLDPSSAEEFANPTLTNLAHLFAQEPVMATGWVHYLVMDLFVGRWIYWEGQQSGVWTVHSLVICLFAGPLGLLSHLLTTAIAARWPKAPTPEETAAP